MIFDTLTPKQHDVFKLVSENRTSKEIAGALGVSESAINQRIEAVRAKAGFPPRAHLARAYRQYTAHRTQEHDRPAHQAAVWQQAGEAFVGADRLSPRDASGPLLPAEWVVPGALSGPEAGLTRVAAMVVIAAGSLIVALVGLGVAQALAAAQ